MAGTVSTFLMCGAVRSADETCFGAPIATNPTSTRRIDFALAHPDVVACREYTFRDPSCGF